MTNPMTTAIESRPDGTSGLVTEPWAAGEIYGVAADWTDGASPVWCYGASDWVDNGKRVADFAHEPRSAMLCELEDSLLSSGDDPDAEDLLNDAVEF